MDKWKKAVRQLGQIIENCFCYLVNGIHVRMSLQQQLYYVAIATRCRYDQSCPRVLCNKHKLNTSLLFSSTLAANTVPAVDYRVLSINAHLDNGSGLIIIRHTSMATGGTVDAKFECVRSIGQS